jgi:osmotically-inducible protein OsmY
MEGRDACCRDRSTRSGHEEVTEEDADAADAADAGRDAGRRERATMDSHSHRNARQAFDFLRAPILSLAMLARVTAASAGMLGALSGCVACSTAEEARMQARDDSTITSAVKAKLASDGDLQSAAIVVTAKQGVVTLKGRVKTDLARERAERDARETDGVRRVIDLVKVGDLP